MRCRHASAPSRAIPKETPMTVTRKGRALAWTVVLTALLLACNATVSFAAPTNFTEFETGQVRPLAMSPDGTHLFAVNTPDGRLEVFSVAVGGITKVGSVPVGLEPCAVAARSNG